MLELYKTDFEYDAIGGIIKSEWWWDTEKKCMLNREVQDIDPVLQTNQAQYNDTDERARFKSETMNKVASIPMIAYQEIKKETGVDILDPNQSKEMRNILNDSDYRKLRTRPCKL